MRAAIEVEGALEHPRYQGFAEHVPMIAVSEDAVLYALELAETADALMDFNPLRSPGKVLETL